MRQSLGNEWQGFISKTGVLAPNEHIDRTHNTKLKIAAFAEKRATKCDPQYQGLSF